MAVQIFNRGRRANAQVLDSALLSGGDSEAV